MLRHDIQRLIREEFGDGIMPTIDVAMTLARASLKTEGDRMRLSMSGHVLPYKDDDNEDGVPDDGFKKA